MIAALALALLVAGSVALVPGRDPARGLAIASIQLVVVALGASIVLDLGTVTVAVVVAGVGAAEVLVAWRGPPSPGTGRQIVRVAVGAAVVGAGLWAASAATPLATIEGLAERAEAAASSGHLPPRRLLEPDARRAADVGAVGAVALGGRPALVAGLVLVAGATAAEVGRRWRRDLLATVATASGLAVGIVVGGQAGVAVAGAAAIVWLDVAATTVRDLRRPRRVRRRRARSTPRPAWVDPAPGRRPARVADRGERRRADAVAAALVAALALAGPAALLPVLVAWAVLLRLHAHRRPAVRFV